MTNEIFEYLCAKESKVGAKLVRDGCRKYMLKRTLGDPTKRQHIPKSWIKDAYLRQNGKCARCHGPLEFYQAVGDHKTPIAHGGQHSRSNIDALHRSCNSSKGANDFVRESKLRQIDRIDDET